MVANWLAIRPRFIFRLKPGEKADDQCTKKCNPNSVFLALSLFFAILSCIIMNRRMNYYQRTLCQIIGIAMRYLLILYSIKSTISSLFHLVVNGVFCKLTCRRRYLSILIPGSPTIPPNSVNHRLLSGPMVIARGEALPTGTLYSVISPVLGNLPNFNSLISEQ